MMMGTPAYMAPEQVQGSRDADPRSDVWALGVMMFELIAGRLPFDAQDAPAIFVAIATTNAPTLLEIRAEVTPAVSRVVERCLRRRLDDRYPSAAELGRDLRHVIEGTELEATGTRSIPPAFAALVPDLAIPRAPRSPSIPHGPRAGAVDPRGDTAIGIAPSLGVEAPPRLEPAARVEAPRRVEPAARVEAPPRVEARSTRLAPGASMSGVGLAPGPAAAMRAPGSHASWGVRPAREATDYSPIIGLGVVGLVTILGTGLLMRLAHRPEGWPVAQFIFAAEATIALAFHCVFALLAAAIGVTFCRRGVLHWRGDLAGGPPSAIVNAVLAGGAFFSAIELVSAVT